MIILGRYKEIYKVADYPSIAMDIGKPSEHKDTVLKYMKACKITSAAPGHVRDVIAGNVIDLPLECKSDGFFAWRSDFAYYIEKYDLRIPEEFIEHILRKTDSI